MNARAYTLQPLTVIWLMLSTLLGGCRPVQHTSAVWYTDSFPKNITDGSQPAIGTGGVAHKVSLCKQIGSGDLFYQARFDNPYSESLTVFIGTSVDGRATGTIWGIYQAELPPGLTEITFETSTLDKEEHDTLFYNTLPSMVIFDVNECAVHIFGFKEGSDFQVVFPVATKKLSSKFELPNTSLENLPAK
jgi:hypothetical protein